MSTTTSEAYANLWTAVDRLTPSERVTLVEWFMASLKPDEYADLARLLMRLEATRPQRSEVTDGQD